MKKISCGIILLLVFVLIGCGIDDKSKQKKGTSRTYFL